MDLYRCGDDAALVELSGRDEVLALRAALLGARPPGVVELVPAARTLLVRFEPDKIAFAGVGALLTELPPVTATTETSEAIVVPVRYDGADLAEVSTVTGLSLGEIIRRHASARYTVAFCGFAPGFGYLTGLDPALRVPRRASPRTGVPAGSVALADEYTGIYPRCSPGGWQLIGRTELSVWDLDREPPAMLVPGREVRFEVAGS